MADVIHQCGLWLTVPLLYLDHLILVAPPAFLGLLRKNLQKPLDKLVERTISKDLTTADIDVIIDYIRAGKN